jgi:dienelactone hydrolase
MAYYRPLILVGGILLCGGAVAAFSLQRRSASPQRKQQRRRLAFEASPSCEEDGPSSSSSSSSSSTTTTTTIRTAATPETAALLREVRETDALVLDALSRGLSLRRTAVDTTHAGTALRSFAFEFCSSSSSSSGGGSGSGSGGGTKAAPKSSEKKPGLLLLHTAVGVHDDFMLWLAERYAAAGFLVLLHDLYGAVVAPSAWEPGTCGQLMAANRRDRATLQGDRAMAGLRTLAELPGCDPGRLAAVGYCYGGQVAMDLVRWMHLRGSSGSEYEPEAEAEAEAPLKLRAAVTMHGILDACPELLVATEGADSGGGGGGGDSSSSSSSTTTTTTTPVQEPVPVLCLHGADDPFIPAESIQAFLDEMRGGVAAVEFVSFAGATHAFTRPEKVPGDARQAFHPWAARRAWATALQFIDDAFMLR